MKKLLFILTVLCMFLSGCGEKSQQQIDEDAASKITKFNYEGHRYIKYSKGFGKTRALGIAHDPDCPCGRP